MRVLYVTKQITPHDRRFLLSLAQSPHQVYCLQLIPVANDCHLQQNIVTLSANFSIEKQSIESLHALQKIIDTINPDVIHAGPIHSVASWIAKLNYQPLVTVSWGFDLLLDADKNTAFRTLTKQVLDASQVLICDCKASEIKAASFGFPKQQIITFPWGVDLNHFSPQKTNLRTQLNWQDKFIMLSARTMEPLYGVEVIAKAFIEVAAKNSDVCLLLLGSGSQRTHLEELFSAAKLTDRVYFAGQVDLQELPCYYSTADLYVSASHTDGSSVSLLEAMACALPSLVSDIPGNKEWIEPEIQGWLFHDNDVKDLAEKMNLAMRSPLQLKTLGRNARATVELRADWNKNCSRLFDAYKLAISSQQLVKLLVP